MPEKVLVTGATGFIGSALVAALQKRGDHVRVLVRRPAKLAEVELAVDDVVEGSITDAAAVNKAVQGIDKVYSIAGTFREPGLSDADYHHVNVEAVEVIIRAAKAAGVKRVVHCSTCGIHGNVAPGQMAKEDDPLRGAGIYEHTKAEGDLLARKLGGELGLEVSVIRPTPVYGPGDTRLLKLFKMANKDRVLMLGRGEGGYHLVYIDDLVQAFLLAAEKPAAVGEAFLIGGPEIPPINEVFRTIGDIFQRTNQRIVRLPALPFWLAGIVCETVCRPLKISPPIYRRRVEFFTNNRAFDISKAQRLLDYRPQVDMKQGLRATADWYRAHDMI